MRIYSNGGGTALSAAGNGFTFVNDITTTTISVGYLKDVISIKSISSDGHVYNPIRVYGLLQDSSNIAYAKTNHNHDTVYAPISHTHSEYAAASHNHTVSYTRRALHFEGDVVKQGHVSGGTTNFFVISTLSSGSGVSAVHTGDTY